MKTRWLASVLTALIVSLFSVRVGAQVSKIDAVYKDIHDDVCSDMTVSPCPRLDEEDERWAFVTTWCKRNPKASTCDTLKGLTGGPVVIAFDHRSKEWRAIYGIDDANVDEVKGTPDVRVASGQRIVAVVEATNPLLYTAEAGAITETDSPAIAALKALFEKLGPSIVKAMAFAEKPLRQDEADKIKAAEDALNKLKCISDQTDAATSFIRTVETGGGATYTLLKASCNVVDEASLKTAFTDLKDAVEPLRSMDFCTAPATALITLLDTPATDTKKLRDNADAVAMSPRCGNIRNPNPPPAIVATPLQELSNRIIARAEAVLKAEKDVASASAATRPAAEAALRTARNQWNASAQGDITTLTRRKDAAASAAELVKAADAIAATAEDLKTALRKLAEFEKRLVEFVVTPSSKTPTAPLVRTEIADFFVVPQGGTPVAWAKVRSRTLTVKESSPYAAVIDAKADVATSYAASVLSATLFDMSVAITHTQLASPVFGVVSEPAPTEADPNAKKNVIAKKDEDERSGQLAVFVSYPLLSIFAPNTTWTRSLDVDLGVGTGEDLPAFFLGASWKIGPIRIGGGSTWQQVKALDGQSIGQTVASADDIKLKNELDRSWYAAFSFSLGETLSLFKK